MKIRYGFVSNSSSSSYVVVDASDGYVRNIFANEYELVIDNNFSVCNFGLQEREWHNVEEKIIWAYLQAKCAVNIVEDPINLYRIYLSNWGYSAKKVVESNPRQWIPLIEEVIKEHCPNIKNIKWNLEFGYGDECGHIDHQSCCYEDAEMIDIFRNKNTLKDFIFGKRSYIKTGNDNW